MKTRRQIRNPLFHSLLLAVLLGILVSLFTLGHVSTDRQWQQAGPNTAVMGVRG